MAYDTMSSESRMFLQRCDVFYMYIYTWTGCYFLSLDYLSYINSLGFFIYFLFPSDEMPMLEMLHYTIRIGSTRFDLYLYSAYAAHYVCYNLFCFLENR